MNSEIVSVGTEILLGEVVNTNASYLSERLAELGINCFYHTVVGDNRERMKLTIKKALNRSDLIIMTGGLGPTYDDITKELVSEVMDEPLVFDENILKEIKNMFLKTGRIMTENNKRQAYVFENGYILKNHKGTAPGLILEKNDKVIILLPGPPKELIPMFEEQVFPYLMRFNDLTLRSKHVYLHGIGESQVESMFKEIMEEYTNPTLATYSDENGLYLRITASGQSEYECFEKIDSLIKVIKRQLSDYIYSVDIPKLEDAFKSKVPSGFRLFVFESNTDGRLLHRLSDVMVEGRYLKKINEEKRMILMLEGMLDQYDMLVGLMRLESGSFLYSIRYQDHKIVEEVDFNRGYRNDESEIYRRATSHVIKAMFDLVVI